MRIPLVAGRMITDADDSTSQHVTVINEAMAKKFFPGENPLGKRLDELGMDRHRDVPMTVVGVVGDVRSSRSLEAADAAALRPVSPASGARDRSACCSLRTSVPPASLGPVARSRLRLLDSNVLTTIETADGHPRALARRSALHDDRARRIRRCSGWCSRRSGSTACSRTPWRGARARSVCAWRSARARQRVVRMVLGDSLAPVVVGAAVGVVGGARGSRD